MKNSVSARLTERTAEEVANAIYKPSMLGFDTAALERMCALNEAHVIMLADRKLIDKEIAIDLLRGIEQIRNDGYQSIDLDPQFEDSYFAFENRLSEIIGKGTAGWLHIGRSRNDIGSTIDRMTVRDTCLDILSELNRARQACLDSAAKHTETVMPGYTHLQPAQPITFGYYLSNVLRGLEREHDRIAAVYDRADACALGSAAFAGTSFNIDRKMTADLLGFDTIATPGLDAVASRDFVTELLWGVTSLQVLLSRVASDFYVFTTWEFGSLGFPDRVAGTSSIMPQKKNMLPLEYFRAEAGRSIGALTGALSAIKGSNYSIGLDSAREGIADAWSTFARLHITLPLLSLIFETATPSAEKLRHRCNENFSTATDLADGLVREHGISFRDAHHIVGHAVQMVVFEGGNAEDLSVAILNKAAEIEIGRTFALDESTLKSWTDPISAVASRNVPGGPAPAIVKDMLSEMQARLDADQETVISRRNRLSQATARLSDRAKALKP